VILHLESQVWIAIGPTLEGTRKIRDGKIKDAMEAIEIPGWRVPSGL